MKNFFKKKITIYFLISFFLVSVIPITIFVFIQYYNVKNKIINHSFTITRQFQDNIEKNINKEISLIKNYFSFFYNDKAVTQALKAQTIMPYQVNEKIKYALAFNKNISAIYILNTNGLCLGASNIKFLYKNYQQYFNLKKITSGKLFFSFFQKKKVFAIKSIERNGKIIGYIVIKFKRLFIEVLKISLKKYPVIFFINSNGKIIFHYNKDYVNKNLFSSSKLYNKELQKIRSLIKRKINKSTGNRTEDDKRENIHNKHSEYGVFLNSFANGSMHSIIIYKKLITPGILSNLIFGGILLIFTLILTMGFISFFFSRFFNSIYTQLSFKNDAIQNIELITKEVIKSNNLDAVIDAISEYLEEKYGFNGVDLVLVTSDKQHYKVEKYKIPEKFVDVKNKYLKSILPLDSDGGRVADCILNNKIEYHTNFDVDEIINPVNKEYVKNLDIKSALIVPINVNNEVIGAMVLRSHFNSISLSKEDIKSIELFVNQVGVILKNMKYFEEVKQKNIDLKKLNEISSEIKVSQNIDHIFDKIADYFEEKYGFNGYGFELVNKERTHYEVRRYRVPEKLKELRKEYLGRKFPLNLEHGSGVAYCILNNEIAYYTDIKPEMVVNKVSRKIIEDLQIKTVLIVPITVENKVIATFGLRSHFKSIYLSKEDINSIETFINQFAVMLKNFLLYTEVKEKSIEVEKAYAELQKTNFELENALNEAEAASKAKTNFLTMMSHELRTPLAGMIGFSEILHDDVSLSKKQHEYASIINDCGKRLLQVLNDVLQLTSLEAGKFYLEYSKFDINDLIDDIQILLKNDIDKKSINFIKETNGIDLIFTDEVRLRQILLNLVGNAIKFTEKGEIILTVEKDENNYKFSVKDTGIGIPKEAQEDIFDTFKQIESLEDRKYGGTGLGLAIVKKLVDVLDGQIFVESEINQGSTFTFYIPIKDNG